MVLPGKRNGLALLASISLIVGGIAISALTEYGVAGVAIAIFGFAIWFAECAVVRTS